MDNKNGRVNEADEAHLESIRTRGMATLVGGFGMADEAQTFKGSQAEGQLATVL